eukprot:gene12351-25986_t
MSSLPQKFMIGANNNFSSLVDAFMHSIISFGDPAREIIGGVVIPLVSPSKIDLDDGGRRVYSLFRTVDLIDPKILSFGPDLSEASERSYAADLQYYRTQKLERDKQSHALLAYIISRLSPESLTSLATHTGPTGFDAAVLAVNTFDVWKLILKTHLYGSGRTKQRQMVDLLGVSQSKSHESYLKDFRDKSELVIGAFESKAHPGFISIDELLKVLYINGLNSAIFDRPINRLHEELSTFTCQQAMELVQQYNLDCTSASSAPSTAFSGRAYSVSTGELFVLAATAAVYIPSGGSPRPVPGSLGVLSAGSTYCPHCWSNGYKHVHLLSDCRHYRRMQQNLVKRLPLKTHSVPPGAFLSGLPAPSSALDMVSLVPPASGGYDADVVFMGEYERQAAISAKAAYVVASGRVASARNNPHGFLLCSIVDNPIALDTASVDVVQPSVCFGSFPPVSLLVPVAFHSGFSASPWCNPFRVGGIADGVLVTHRGFLSFLPRSIATAYYAAGRRRPDHYKFPGFQFGDVCLVQEFEDKRRREAADGEVPTVYRAELQLPAVLPFHSTQVPIQGVPINSGINCLPNESIPSFSPQPDGPQSDMVPFVPPVISSDLSPLPLPVLPVTPMSTLLSPIVSSAPLLPVTSPELFREPSHVIMPSGILDNVPASVAQTRSGRAVAIDSPSLVSTVSVPSVDADGFVLPCRRGVSVVQARAIFHQMSPSAVDASSSIPASLVHVPSVLLSSLPHFPHTALSHHGSFSDTVSNDQQLVDDLFQALASRFGPLTLNPVSTVHTGLEFIRHANGAISITQDQAICQAASKVGVSHLDSVLLPAFLDFFDPPISPDECVAIASTLYSSLTGQLVQFLKTRHEIRPYISHLCSYNSAPMEGHYRKALHVLRYLVSTPGQGSVFKSFSGDLCAASDAAYGIYSGGRSSSGYLLSVLIQDSVATCPMTAEYYAMGSVCKDIMFYRQLSKDLGSMSYLSPTVLQVDNKTAISLAVAPQMLMTMPEKIE